MTQTEALKALVHEMEYVLSCINENKVPFDADDFHEALRLGKEALSQTENDKERCVGCEACIDTACGRDECPKGWPKAAQPEQEPVAYIHRNEYNEYRLEPHDNFDIKSIPFNVDVSLFKSSQRTWVGLTNDERMEIYSESLTIWSCMEAVEAKLRGKNA